MPIFVLGFCAPMMLPALILAIIAGEYGMAVSFALPMGMVLGASLPVWRSLRQDPIRITPKDGFLLVFLTWAGVSLAGALPYYLSGEGFSLTDAVFESVCGFATTGATTVSNIEGLPKSLLFWRSLTHWFGGMGILLLTVALMPIFGVGGFQLIKAEAPGPEKEKVAPKITSTAKILWLVYCGLTFSLFILYLLGGMTGFDAICHALGMVATGGVSTKNAGIGFYNSAFIDWASTIFMLLAGFNFNLYYRLFQGQGKDILHNTEGRLYLAVFLGASGIITCSLVPVYGSFGGAVRYGAYQTASILTTTGSAITDYETWPPLAQSVLFLLMFAGGCSGSTAGGIKLIRHAVLFKQMVNELRRLVYPRGIFSVQLNRKVGRKDVVYGVAGFTFLYMLTAGATALLTAASGTDVFSAFSAALAVIGNLGLGFGAAGPGGNFGEFPDPLKWLFSFVMLAGRLELWTLFILFTPEYWR